MTHPITKCGPDTFELQYNTVWSFPDRGTWATHDAKYRGNWSPYIPRNLILRYSQEGDTVLDPFVGGGTTMIEAKLLNRNGIGIDINPESLRICRDHLDFDVKTASRINLITGDARNLSFLKSASVDLITAHPPYANIIQYSDRPGDLSTCKIPQFLEEMKPVASECFRVLKEGKFCAVLMGDTRKNGHVHPLGFEVMNVFESAGFHIKEIIIKEQHNCKTTGYWKSSSVKYNFLLLAHEYLFVFKKENKQKRSRKTQLSSHQDNMT